MGGQNFADIVRAGINKKKGPEVLESARKQREQAKAVRAGGKGAGVSAYQTSGRSSLTLSSAGGGGGGTSGYSNGRNVGLNIPN